MRYLILGAGAVGGVVGARLFQAGHQVVLLARGPHLDAIRQRGLRFETPEGTETLAIRAVGHPADLGATSADVVLLTTKTQHTAAALDDLRIAFGPEVPVVCVQNGVENERLAARRFRHVYGALALLPASHLQPGCVQAHCVPVCGVVDVGCYPAGQDAFCEQLAGDLAASGLVARSSPDIMRWKYAKLLSNLGNALEAACGSNGDWRPLYARLRDEATACFTAAGISWEPEAELHARQQALSPMGVIAGQGRQGGSSWQSLARRTGSIETDYLNGEIALLGRLHGVPTPANAAVQELAAQMARDGAAPGSVSLAEVLRAMGG